MVSNFGIYIALGSNVGDRARHVREALAELTESGEIAVAACSALHETKPVGGPNGQENYINAVAAIRTALSPAELLARLQEIERRHGRERVMHHGPRTLDLDLLLYRDQRVDTPDLQVPHPRMWERGFVMTPLREICSDDQYAALLTLRPAAS